MNQAHAIRKKPDWISPADFFSRKSEKTKLNWFFFETAREIQSKIKKPLRKKLRKEGITKQDLAKFCIYYTKQIERPMLEQLNEQASNTFLSRQPIQRFFPSLSDRLVDDLLSVVLEAWDSMLEVCEICPVRCLSEKEARTEMFDDPVYYD